jgi:hypothetical protein
VIERVSKARALWMFGMLAGRSADDASLVGVLVCMFAIPMVDDPLHPSNLNLRTPRDDAFCGHFRPLSVVLSLFEATEVQGSLAAWLREAHVDDCAAKQS